MKIEGDTVVFKSFPHLWEAERSGAKSNTLRKITDRDEYKAFMGWVTLPARKIEIVNSTTYESFTRNVTHVYDDWPTPLFVISWKHEDAGAAR